MKTYENLQILQSQFFTNEVMFVYIWSNLNIYWVIGFQIHSHQIQTNSYSVTIDYLQFGQLLDE
jgi:hypothetical protein